MGVRNCSGLSHDLIAVFVHPTLDIPNVTLLEGDPARTKIVCKSSDNLRNVDEMWFFNDLPVQHSFQQFLNFQDITRDMAGTYRCQLFFDGQLLEALYIDFDVVVECEYST